MPIINDLTKTMESHINSFYDNASVYRPNKFFVGFFGEYVKMAVDKMEAKSKGKLVHATNLYEREFNRWKETFYTTLRHPVTGKNEGQIDMRWACAGITIPHTSSEIDNTQYIDSLKSIKYPIIKGTASTGGEVVINVREDKTMMWYHFFNAMNNSFYRAQILKPRSSFQKVSIYVVPVQEQFVNTPANKENGVPRTSPIDFVTSQVFEFNSVVLKTIGSFEMKNDNKEILEYKVTFTAPNTFQGSFNETYRGLADNTTCGFDSNMLIETQKNVFGYNDGNFTIPIDTLKSETNGYYKDYTTDVY